MCTSLLTTALELGAELATPDRSHAMTAIVARPRCHDLEADHDQRVYVHVSWAQFEAFLEMRGEAAGPRVVYRNGCLELMSVSRRHEWIKKTIARLVEAYTIERDIECNGYGGWTLKNVTLEEGLEPDECYLFGADHTKDRPDLAIEVIWTHGGIDKLEIYRGLGVPEVWVWEDGRIRVFALSDGSYVERGPSQWLPQLDLARVCALLDRESQTQAVRELIAWLRADETRG